MMLMNILIILLLNSYTATLEQLGELLRWALQHKLTDHTVYSDLRAFFTSKRPREKFNKAPAQVHAKEGLISASIVKQDLQYSSTKCFAKFGI